MLYNCDNPDGVVARVADAPGARGLIQPCFLIRLPTRALATSFTAAQIADHPQIHSARPMAAPAAFMLLYVSRYAPRPRRDDNLFRDVSTWNPYQVVLMKSTIANTLIRGRKLDRVEGLQFTRPK